MACETLVLDYDGVIVDSEPVQLHSVNKVVASYGVVITSTQWTTVHMGNRTRTILKAVLPDMSDRELAALIAHKKEVHRGLRRADPLPCRPGIVELVGEAVKRAVPVVVASSSSTVDIEEDLRDLGLGDHIRHVVGGDAVEHPKPAPDAYLRALEVVDGNPSTALAVEDTPIGISAAKAAGLYCIAYVNDFTSHLDLSEADEVVQQLTPDLIGRL